MVAMVFGISRWRCGETGQAELYNKLMENGIEVYVKTTASEALVRMVALFIRNSVSTCDGERRSAILAAVCAPACFSVAGLDFCCT
jgi:hypothetical protein